MSVGACRCICRFWGHGGICTGGSDRTVTFEVNGEPVPVRVCNPCAQDIGEAEALHDETEREAS